MAPKPSSAPGSDMVLRTLRADLHCSQLPLATQTLMQVSSRPNNVAAADIACRTLIAFSGPSYYSHQDLTFDATVDLRLFPNLHSEVVASVPAYTGDMRPSSWTLALLPSP